MNKEDILKTLEIAKNNSKKRNFKQGIDLIVNLSNVDLKKNKVEGFVTLTKPIKKRRIGAFVDADLKDQAKEICDVVVLKDEFVKYKDKKLVKKLANQADFFIAQVHLMPQVASIFGRFLGSRGKMPNPKIGGVIPPKTNLKLLVERLNKTLMLEAKGGSMIKTLIGNEDSSVDDVVNNVMSVHEALITLLPKGKENIKNFVLKLTMGIPVRIGEKEEDVKKRLALKEEESKPKKKEIKKDGKA